MPAPTFSDYVRTNLQQASTSQTVLLVGEQDRMSGIVAAGAVIVSALLIVLVLLLAANARAAKKE